MSSSPLRVVLFVTLWGQPSETFVRREVAAATAAGCEVTVISLRPPVVDDADPSSVIALSPKRVIRLCVRAATRHPLRSARFLARVLRFSSRRTVVRHLGAAAYGMAASEVCDDVEIAHAHFAWLSATSADAFAALRGIPLSVFPHAFDVFEDEFIDGYLRDKLRRASVVAVESDTMLEDLQVRFGCRSTVVRMGVERSWIRQSPRPPSTGRSILSVGMLREKKGHDLLIRAAIELDATLRIVGDGPQRAELEGLITELGANDRVHLLGLKTPEEVRALLDAADVFCLASRPVASGDRDGVPNVLIEAMARGVPVVSTRLSGIPDLVAPERGVLVDPDDEKALAAGLRRVLDDPGGAASRAATALEHVSSEYVTDVNWSKLEALMRLAVA